MATCMTSQSAFNMLRRSFVVLQLCSLLVVCSCYFVRGNASRAASISIHCRKVGNSKICGSRAHEIQSTHSQTPTTEKIIKGELEEGDGKMEEVTSRKKKGKGSNMLLYILGAGKVTMLYAIFNAVAAIAGKALIVAKVALAVATAIALKKAFEHKDHVAYEIVKHPYHTYENTHSSSIDYEPYSAGGLGEGDWKRRKVFQ